MRFIHGNCRKQVSRLITKKQVYMNYTVCSTCIDCERTCKLCPACTSEEDLDVLQEAYLEHVNRIDFRRVFPVVDIDKVRENI
jgi:hypothetical protein